jgi:hypothetical protein
MSTAPPFAKRAIGKGGIRQPTLARRAHPLPTAGQRISPGLYPRNPWWAAHGIGLQIQTPMAIQGRQKRGDRRPAWVANWALLRPAQIRIRQNNNTPALPHPRIKCHQLCRGKAWRLNQKERLNWMQGTCICHIQRHNIPIGRKCGQAGRLACAILENIGNITLAPKKWQSC